MLKPLYVYKFDNNYLNAFLETQSDLSKYSQSIKSEKDDVNMNILAGKP